MVTLTNNADYVLCVLYAAYLTKRKNGEEEIDACSFGGAEELQEEYFQTTTPMDLFTYVSELDKAEYVKCWRSNNLFHRCELRTAGIVYMEGRFGRKFDKVAERIATLRTIILG